jgi:hypothetical protein
MAADPAIGAVVLVGQARAATPGGLGTWEWTGRTWSLLSPTTPDQADSMGYDPVSHRLLAYGGTQPSSPSGNADAAGTVGYSQTSALTGTGWVQLHPPSTPGRTAGVLTVSPDLRRLLLVTALGQTWTWTGQTWQHYPARNAPAGSSSWSGATMTAATDPSRHQIVLLVTNDGAADQTWTLSNGTWTRQTATP